MVFYEKLKKLLYQADFSEAEVCVYIELLKKPMESIWKLMKRTGLRKSTVYDAFARLQKWKMVERTEDRIRALSLKVLVSKLSNQKRKLGKIAYQLKQLSPFLHTPPESIEEFETFYTSEQIAEIYLMMSELPYEVNLDFGDYENFINAIGGNELGIKFRTNRAKHASHRAVCTTFGPNLAYFCKKEDLEKYQSQFDVRNNISFRNRWIIFSDTNNYVLFNDVSDQEYPTSILVKSKVIADIQRQNFDIYSELLRSNE